MAIRSFDGLSSSFSFFLPILEVVFWVKGFALLGVFLLK